MKTIFDFKKKKESKQKISMLTCYDHWSAKILNKSSIDAILVGDSVAMVMYGHQTTLPATVEMMAYHCEAVCKGAPDKFIVGDLPFLSYRSSLEENIKAVHRIMQTGVHAVKLEGAHGNLDFISHLVQSGVPVMGHLGLTPQSVFQLGGFKVQGKSSEAQTEILNQALALEKAGCFSIVLECVPSNLATLITNKLAIPTIGIGAGASTDGQILVLQDMLGLNSDFKPKFVRHFINGEKILLEGIEFFHNETINQTFPSNKESFE